MELSNSDQEDRERKMLFDDTLDDLKEASDAMRDYLQLVNPENLVRATDAARTSLSLLIYLPKLLISCQFMKNMN